MLGTLGASQIEDVLRAGTVGRIGVHEGGRTYVVPVSYAYDGDAVYVHSPEGQKVRMMRASPDVCFEVEEIDDLANWRTVIAWGRFEELEGDIASAAVNLLVARLAPLRSSETAGPAGPAAGTAGAAGVAYRIRLTERTGRFEKS
ncbi:MAG TPA: pyridoxamine 5'-phosphate oxidase family protein [Candidatus Limnocylindria bacterium]|nr:pyridoxamine 5'-phosphate oxidase family protein [Candidatus Limnocylindria bacterium]